MVVRVVVVAVRVVGVDVSTLISGLKSQKIDVLLRHLLRISGSDTDFGDGFPPE